MPDHPLPVPGAGEALAVVRRRDAPLAGARILLAGSDAALFGGALRALGCTVQAEADGLAAWGRASTGWFFDLLVTSPHLAGLEGVQLVEALRAERPWLPVVLLARDAVAVVPGRPDDGALLVMPPSAPAWEVGAAIGMLLRPDTMPA